MLDVRYMRQKRGQSSIEYVVLIGLLLFFFIPLVHYSFLETNNALKASQLDSFISRLSKAVDAVHSIGPGTREIVIVTLPKGVTEARLFNGENLGDVNEIILKVTFYGGVSDVHASVKPFVYGELPINPGTYHLKVTSINETGVNISIN